MLQKHLALIYMLKKVPMAHSDNKTTEEEKEEDAGWEKSAASLIISEKTEKRETLPIGMGLINKVLSERNSGQKKWLDSIFPWDCLQSLNWDY